MLSRFGLGNRNKPIVVVPTPVKTQEEIYAEAEAATKAEDERVHRQAEEEKVRFQAAQE